MRILKVAIWPFFACIIFFLTLLLFREHIAPKEMQLSPKGIKISFYLLEAAERGSAARKSPATPPNAKEIQVTAKRASGISLEGAKILWVDDNPQNQEYERKAFGALGVQFILAESTEKALAELSKQQFQLVITDFKRADDERAGYTLLIAIKKVRNSPPVIIYSSASTPQLEEEAKQMGAFAETNQPERLFNLAIDAIKAQ
jgi:CheY-like chemotaxis protein